MTVALPGLRFAGPQPPGGAACVAMRSAAWARPATTDPQAESRPEIERAAQPGVVHIHLTCASDPDDVATVDVTVVG